MAERPGGDLGGMLVAIGKDEAKAVVPFAGNPPPNPSPAVPALPMADKSLTVKLRGNLYEALCDHCHDARKANGGTRVTHQEVMVEALKRFLAAPKG